MESKGVGGWLGEMPVSALNPSTSKRLFTENTDWWGDNLSRIYMPLLSFSLLLTFLTFSMKKKLILAQQIRKMLAFLHPPSSLFSGIVQASFFFSVSCESHPQPTSRHPFFSNETHCMDTCGLPFPLWGGVEGWGAWQHCQLLIETRWLIAQGLAS